MRLAFMGTPAFAVPVLRSLAERGHEIARVYTQPPRPAGRGKSVRKSPVHMTADQLDLATATPIRFRDPDVVAEFQSLDLDAAVVVAYGQILPQEVLDAPRLGCINLHASLLPRWRGAAPIQRAIMAGDTVTGVAVMQMEAGLDTGPVLSEARVEIRTDDTVATLHDRLVEAGVPLMLSTLDALDSGHIKARPQSEDGVTYAAKITKEEARVDWCRPAAEVDCHIRGLSPAPGAWCEIDGTRVKLLMSTVEPGHGVAGTALDDQLLIACGDGAVRLTTLQKAGRAAGPARDFLNGHPVPAGTLLE